MERRDILVACIGLFPLLDLFETHLSQIIEQLGIMTTDGMANQQRNTVHVSIKLSETKDMEQ